MISIFSAISLGLKDVYKSKKLVLVFFLIQFLFAYFMTKPISQLLTKAFSTSTLSDVVLNRFDLRYFSTMFREFGQGVNLFGFIMPLIILYLLISIFLTAGAYWFFYTKSEFHLSEYFVKCGNYFGRFLKLFLFSGLFYLICLIIFSLVGGIFDFLTKDTITEVWPVILFFVNIGITVILIAMVLMVFDYAKILLIDESATGIVSAVFEAFKFFMMNFFKTIGIFLIYIILGVVLFAVFNSLESLIVTNTFIMIALYFILTQTYVFLRQYLRLALYDTLIVYYQNSMTALPGMLNKEMLEMAVEHYEKRKDKESQAQ